LISGKNKPNSAKNEVEKGKKVEKSRVIVSVTSISCAKCALAIEKQVKRIEGIEEVKTAIMLNKIFIDYNPKLVDLTTIRKAIEKTGYKSYMTIEEKR